ncbi:MAG: hypothetical protein HFG27_09175 [Provencibacterium sp.]|jgi:hypothetical protein|nr:hypothetical protein [Provencibacterium sp.]
MAMDSSKKWLALGYSLPINPSRNRVYVWRKLKELGAEYFKQGVAILPGNRKNSARLSRLQQRIVELGGEAQLVELRFLNPRDEAALIEKFRRQSDSEYAALLHECGDLFTQLAAHAGQKLSEYEADRLKKAVRKYAQAKNRDHFSSGFAHELEEKLYDAVDSLRASASDFAAQLQKTLDKL